MKDVNEASVKSVVLRRVIGFAKDYGGIPLIVGVVVGLVAIFIYGLWLGFSTVEKWTSSIEDPTERGLAYIAAAIVFHAFFGKSDVDVKVDGKRP
jgi:flagellar basal body-associated protein FliL